MWTTDGSILKSMASLLLVVTYEGKQQACWASTSRFQLVENQFTWHLDCDNALYTYRLSRFRSMSFSLACCNLLCKIPFKTNIAWHYGVQLLRVIISIQYTLWRRGTVFQNGGTTTVAFALDRLVCLSRACLGHEPASPVSRHSYACRLFEAKRRLMRLHPAADAAAHPLQRGRRIEASLATLRDSTLPS
jgi:hypothetical protein